MAETGECLVPVCVTGGRLRDGQHRIAIAWELGLGSLPVTDDMTVSTYRRYVVVLAGQMPKRLQALAR
jgi:hypothetical protein